eukprot:622992-Rhodomonas_salina.1
MDFRERRRPDLPSSLWLSPEGLHKPSNRTAGDFDSFDSCQLARLRLTIVSANSFPTAQQGFGPCSGIAPVSARRHGAQLSLLAGVFALFFALSRRAFL